MIESDPIQRPSRSNQGSRLVIVVQCVSKDKFVSEENVTYIQRKAQKFFLDSQDTFQGLTVTADWTQMCSALLWTLTITVTVMLRFYCAFLKT